MRTILTGTKYGIKNPKVVAMGLGKAGATSAAKMGGIVTIVLLTAYRITDYALTDKATLSQLVGTLATDIVKVGITTGASIAAATIAGGFAIAVGPILAVVLVGVGVALALDALDRHYGITERVIEGLDELSDSAQLKLEQTKQNLQNIATEAVNSIIDYTLGSARKMVIDVAAKSLRRFLSPLPKVR